MGSCVYCCFACCAFSKVGRMAAGKRVKEHSYASERKREMIYRPLDPEATRRLITGGWPQ